MEKEGRVDRERRKRVKTENIEVTQNKEEGIEIKREGRKRECGKRNGVKGSENR